MKAVLVLLVVTGCWVDERDVALPELPVADSVQVFDMPVFVGRKLDLLYVVESSPAMVKHEARLAAEVSRMAWVLRERSDDLHIGVITSDLGGDGCRGRGDEGALRATEELTGAPFLIDWHHLDGTRSANFEGELADVLPRLTGVGHHGCERAQPLAALVRALADHPRNLGFRRDDADLLVIIVAAQDDASPLPVDEAVAYLQAPATDPDHTLVAGIVAGPAPRLAAFFAGFPHRATVSAFDTVDLAGTALSLLRGFGWGGRGPLCMEARIDLEPAEPGIQHACSISDVVIEDRVRVHERVLPACDPTSSVRPCWRIEVDHQNCPSDNELTLRVDRRDYPVRGTHVIGSCVTRAGDPEP